jgi:hypothetical protein
VQPVYNAGDEAGTNDTSGTGRRNDDIDKAIVEARSETGISESR